MTLPSGVAPGTGIAPLLPRTRGSMQSKGSAGNAEAPPWIFSLTLLRSPLLSSLAAELSESLSFLSPFLLTSDYFFFVISIASIYHLLVTIAA